MEKTEGRVCVFCKKVIQPDDEMGMFTVITGGKVENAHKSCHQKHGAEKSNLRIKIR